MNVDATGDFLYVGGALANTFEPMIYVVHGATNSVVQTIHLSSSPMFVDGLYLSPGDSTLYVPTQYNAFGSGGRIHRQAIYRIRAAGAASALIDEISLSDTPYDLAFSETLKTAAVALPFSDGVDLVDFSDTRSDGVHVIDLGPGEIVVGIDFGNRSLPSVIQGRVWNDLNANSLWDQPVEPALEGWTVYADLNGNGQFDQASEPFDVTDAQGAYWLGDLDAGTYEVAEVPQAGWEQTFPTVADGGLHQITLGWGEVVSAKDFGNRVPPSEIRGFKTDRQQCGCQRGQHDQLRRAELGRAGRNLCPLPPEHGRRPDA